MTYTPLTSNKIGEVQIRACMKPPFVDYTVFPTQYAGHLGATKYSGSALVGYASYLEDGADTSFIVNLSDGNTLGRGFKAATKFMMWTAEGTDYHVYSVPHDVSDPDDLTGAALTNGNVGNDGMAIDGSTDISYLLVGRSAAGGDSISWLECRGADVYLLTSDGVTLNREQAFELEGAETFDDFSTRNVGWLYDGENFWYLCPPSTDTGNGPPVLVRFKPTAISDPYDYEKFEITFDDAYINSQILITSLFGISITGDTFIHAIADNDLFGSIMYIEVSRDGSEYTSYTITGNDAVAAFTDSSAPYLTRDSAGNPKLYGYGYGGLSDYALGTYDLTCTGATNQGHVYAKKRTLGPPIITSGYLVPSGDQQTGTSKFKLSGDMGPGFMLWKEVK